MPLADILLQGALAVVHTAIVGCAGVILHLKGALPMQTKKHVSEMLVLVMLPALLVTSIGATFTSAKILSWWSLPVFGIAHMCIGFVFAEIGWGILSRCSSHKTDSVDYRRCILVNCCVANNAVVLPMMYTEALCEGDNILSRSANCRTDSFAFIAIYSIPSVLVLFSYCANSLRHRQKNAIHCEPERGHQCRGVLARIRLCLSRVSPPLWATAFGIGIGLIPPLQRFLFGEPPNVLAASLSQLGSGAIPIAVILLVANLCTAASSHEAQNPQPSSVSSIQLESAQDSVSAEHSSLSADICFIGVFLFIKLVAIPFTATVLFLLVRNLSTLAEASAEFLFVLLLGSAMPPAMNVNTVAQRNAFTHRLLSWSLLTGYIASLVTAPLWITWFLWIIEK